MIFIRLSIDAAKLWVNERADQYAAALAYYILFAVTPFLLLSITLVGFLIGTNEVTSLLLHWGNLINPDLTTLLDTTVRNFHTVTTGYYLPTLTIILFSTVVIMALNNVTRGLHALWHIHSRGWRAFLHHSVKSIIFVLFLQIYLVCIILFGSSISYLIIKTNLTKLVPVTTLLFFVSTIALLTIGYKLLSVTAPSLHARLAGATVSSILFLFMREIVILDIGVVSTPDLFGTAGVVVLLLIWIYVGASILFYGAAFAKVYDTTYLRS